MKKLKTVVRWILYILVFKLAIIILIMITLSLATKPSNDRNWNDDQKLLPYTELSGDTVNIHNIRNFTYASTTSYTADYYDKSFDLSKLNRVWYIVEPFSGIPGSAHTFLSFEFDDEQFVSISVEIRKEKGEVYHPVKGLFNQYELMYVIADERDVVQLRTNHRKDLVYVYPIKATQEKMRAIFLDMLARTNKLYNEPEFYNTITNTCTTNIVKHVNKITPKKIPFSFKVLLPANSDRLAYDLGMIDTDLSFEESRKKYLVNEKAMKYANYSDFSSKIREDL
ncbi:MAG: DUF4105 domain-containing protein [Candidatus Paceibacterota bacterium]|jgi:hypothetical protein